MASASVEGDSEDPINTKRVEQANETAHFWDTRRCIDIHYRSMNNKFQSSNGDYLEDLLFCYAYEQEELSPAQFCIVDEAFLDAPDIKEEVLRQLPLLSLLPRKLLPSMDCYTGVTMTNIAVIKMTTSSWSRRS